MSKGYSIIIGSPVDYEELVAYIVIGGREVALVSQEEGKDQLRVEFFDEPRVTDLPYEPFVAALQQAKLALLQ
ncbi:hypothetical protein [Hymenobacter sp. B81]|uniref:hypothetical protein n=1 Tax=Hymenobacter sp. B81 TaxID=3344878 RepID=UPI0037DC309E